MAEGKYDVNVVIRVIDQMSDKLNTIAQNTNSFKITAAAGLMYVGQQFSAMGRRAEEAINDMVGAYADFDAAIKNSISIMNGGVEAQQELIDMANKLAEEYGVDADTIAQGYYQLASAGYDANEILKLTPGILQLSKATMTDFYTTADITTTALNAFGMSAEDTAYVTNVLMNTVKSGKTTLAELAVTLPYAGAAAHAAGVDIQTLGAAIVTLRNAGIDASMAGTQLRAIFAQLVDPSTQEKLKELGVEIVKNKDGSLNFVATMQNLKAALDKVGDKTQQLAILNDIFGLRAANAAKILADQSGELGKLADQLGDTGTLTNALGIQMDSTASKLAQANAKVDEAKRAWGEALAPSLIQVKNAEASIYQWAAKLPEPLKGVVAVGMEGASIFGQFGGALMGLGAVMQMLGPIKAMFSAIFTSTTAAETAAQWSFNAAVLANPLTWIIVAIIGLVLLLWKYWEPITKGMKALWEKLSAALKTAWDKVIKPLFMFIYNFYKTEFTLIYMGLKWVWDNILQPIFKGLWDFYTAVFQKIAEGVKWFWENILSPLFAGIKNFAEAVWNKLMDAINWGYEHIMKPVMDAIKWFWENILQPVLDGIDKFVSGAQSVLGSISDGIGSVLSFDNPLNDEKARRWGRDYATHFMAGLQEVMPSTPVSGTLTVAGAGAVTKNITMNVEINGANYTPEELIEELNDYLIMVGD